MTLGTEMPPAKRSASMSMLASCVTLAGPSVRISSGEILCSAASYRVSHEAFSSSVLSTPSVPRSTGMAEDGTLNATRICDWSFANVSASASVSWIPSIT